MAQSEFKEYIHVNLALVLPHVEQNDDLVQNKKMLPNGLVFYYMYLSEMNDEDKIKEAIETLLQEEDTLTLDTVAKRLDKINARPVFTSKEAVISILRGKCAVFINGLDSVYILSTGKREKRSVNEPTSEKVVRGPKIAFIEDSDTNIAMIRQRTNHPKLKTKKVPIGENKLKYATVMYIDLLPY